ncbi:MAG: FhaA domain-containing protein, partial [Acidimicrobiia bacterium]
MNLARGLERRLEKLADGASASVFRGKMHPIDIASRLVRQLEFLARETFVGPEVPNDLVVHLNPADVDEALNRNQLVEELRNVVTETAASRGWRLVGPVVIQMTTSADVPRGILEVEGTNAVSSTPAWGQLIADDGSAVLAISLNRTLIGRALDSDIRVANREVSRHHVIMYRQDGTTMIQDLGSANGTYLNGVKLTEEPAPINGGDTVMLGDLAFTYRPLF